MNELHELIAEWAGLECQCQRTVLWKGTPEETVNRYWGSCPRHSNGGNPPDYSQNSVAVGLLDSLHQVATYIELSGSRNNGWWIRLWDRDACMLSTVMKPTIASAICAAVEKLMDQKVNHATL